jgi:hypothetical protein
VAAFSGEHGNAQYQTEFVELTRMVALLLLVAVSFWLFLTELVLAPMKELMTSI